MTYGSVYEAVYELYDRENGWEEMVTVGDRESLNVATEALGRHGTSNDTGLRIRDFDQAQTEEYSFATLNAAANRVANYLTEHTDRYDRITAMLSTRLELYAVVYGTLKAGMIYVPLSPMFGRDALNARISDSGATVMVTSADLCDPNELDLGTVDRIVRVGSDTFPQDTDCPVDEYRTVRDCSDSFNTVETHPNDICALSYTSGTTGPPKGVPLTHGSRMDLHPFVEYVVDLRPDDDYFVAASPAWSYGLVMGSMMPGIRGTAIGCYRGEFSPEALFETFEEWSVDNAMVPPTALREAQSAGINIGSYDIDIRVLISAGEPLDSQTVQWCETHLGAPPQDAYGLTEGGMVVCNFTFGDWEIKPGSMGKPTPGYEVALLNEGERVSDGEIGEIAIKRPEGAWGMYWGRPEESVQMFSGEWRLTGDLARKDDDGYFWFVSRKDNIIISAGYRIGPEEVEETLIKHDSVEESAVIGVSHETRGNIVKAYVSLVTGVEPSDSLSEELTQFARSQLSKHEYPREIEFVEDLPKTATGKIDRTALGEESTGEKP
jgi:acetyl-CoA synthetase